MNITQAQKKMKYRKVPAARNCANCTYRNEMTNICTGSNDIFCFKIKNPLTHLCNNWKLTWMYYLGLAIFIQNIIIPALVSLSLLPLTNVRFHLERNIMTETKHKMTAVRYPNAYTNEHAALRLDKQDE